MSAMVQIFSWGERLNVPFNEAKPSWMEHFIFHGMEISVPLHEWENIHYLFYITCTKIQILKQIWKENAPVAFAPRRVSHIVFLINLI